MSVQEIETNLASEHSGTGDLVGLAVARGLAAWAVDADEDSRVVGGVGAGEGDGLRGLGSRAADVDLSASLCLEVWLVMRLWSKK